jgi:hypothetical protein
MTKQEGLLAVGDNPTGSFASATHAPTLSRFGHRAGSRCSGALSPYRVGLFRLEQAALHQYGPRNVAARPIRTC